MTLTKRSSENLSKCHNDLKKIFTKVNEIIPCEIICGYRGKEDQDKAFLEKKSKKKFPESKHNKMPSEAVDVMPIPINWKDREKLLFFAGVVLGVAESMNIKLRWGGDFNNNKNLKDDNFLDLPHFELI